MATAHQSSRPREIFADDDDPRSVRVERRAATPLERVQRPRAHVRRVPEVCFPSQQLKTKRPGTREALAGRTRIAVGVLRVVTLEQIAVGDVVEKKFAHVRTDERAIAVRAHERDAREHRTGRLRSLNAPDGSNDCRRNVDRERIRRDRRAGVESVCGAPGDPPGFGVRSEVSGLGTRMWFEKREGRARRDGRRTGGVARGGTSS